MHKTQPGQVKMTCSINMRPRAWHPSNQNAHWKISFRDDHEFRLKKMVIHTLTSHTLSVLISILNCLVYFVVVLFPMSRSVDALGNIKPSSSSVTSKPRKRSKVRKNSSRSNCAQQ